MRFTNFKYRIATARQEPRPTRLRFATTRQAGGAAAPPYPRCGGFTMVEVAISLAIIGIALVGIIGVLPMGMRTQQDVREETIVNQDATILMEDIRNGAKGADDLTNYVYAITNTWILYNANGTTNTSGVNGYTYTSGPGTVTGPYLNAPINCGTNIIGLLTTPEFQGLNGSPNPSSSEYYSNHIVAYVYSISGPAVEKPPQDITSIMRQSSFAYRMIVQNVPVPLAPPPAPGQANATAGEDYNYNMQANLYELRLFFRWPQQPNGSLGPGSQSFRTMIAGQLAPDYYQTNLYFFQSQAFRTNTDIAAESQGGGP
jgi:prepilin-type N-terminal cleavage/methylation domain-containing protein